MKDKSNTEFVNIDNARHDSQRSVMEEIASNEECPFCPDAIEKYHKQEIVRRGKLWLLTYNQWPYDHTDLHLLAIANDHVEDLVQLSEGAFDELQDHFTWASQEFRIKAGSIAMRFGDITKTGATVNHLHAHLIVPSDNREPGEKVRFRMSS